MRLARLERMRTAWAWFLGVLCAAGCVDPSADLDAFQRRVASRPPTDGGSGQDGAGCNVAPGDIQGRFELAISASIAPTKPILALADVTTPSLGTGTGIAMRLQPLSASDRKTLVDAPIDEGPFAVASDGSFHAELSDLNVSGTANPITVGAAIAADLVLTGSLCANDHHFCGDASGHVTSPITLDLTGSTFTLTPAPEGSDLPERPAINCAGDLADPL